MDDEYASPNAIVGFTVVDKRHGEIGKVQSVENLDVNPIMVVGDKQTLIPFHPEFISKIDFREHQVRVSLPDGLLEINS